MACSRLETRNLQQLFPLDFSVFCQNTEFFYGPRLFGYTIYVMNALALLDDSINGAFWP